MSEALAASEAKYWRTLDERRERLARRTLVGPADDLDLLLHVDVDVRLVHDFWIA